MFLMFHGKNYERQKTQKNTQANVPGTFPIYISNKYYFTLRGVLTFWNIRSFLFFLALILFSVEHWNKWNIPLDSCTYDGTIHGTLWNNRGFSGHFEGYCTMRLEEVVFVFLMCFLLGYLLGGMYERS